MRHLLKSLAGSSQGKQGTFVVLVLAVLLPFALASKASDAASLGTSFGGKIVAVDTKRLFITPEDAAKLDPAEYYVDSSLGFVLKKPLSGDWLAAELLEGVAECLEAKKGVLDQERIERLRFTMQAHPLGPMLRAVEAIRFATGDVLTVELTDQSTNDVAEESIRYTMESEQIIELNLGDAEVEKLKTNIRRSALSFEKMTFANEFTIYVCDKSKLVGVPVRHSLAGFAMVILGQVGLALDQLIADERAVVAGGTLIIQRAKVDGAIQGLHIERLYVVTESEDNYYLIETAFSPQTKKAARIRADLERMLTSFAVLN